MPPAPRFRVRTRERPPYLPSSWQTSDTPSSGERQEENRVMGTSRRYTRRMRTALFLGLSVLGLMVRLDAQEKPLPKNETRIQVPGCAYNRTFITGTAPAGEPVGSIKEGRRLK